MKIIDMHSDTISSIMKDNDLSLFDADRMINIKKLLASNYAIQFFAMFILYIDKRKENYNPYDYCNEMIDRYYVELDKNKEFITPVYTNKDIEYNLKHNKLSSLLTIEEGGVCLGDINKLIHFYNRGVRLMTITWNFKNELASPNIDYTNIKDFKNFKPSINTKDGLTDIGIKFIKKMNELGMVIDLSHASDATFFDVIKYSNKPIVCSHSCVRALRDHPRNMSDEMLYKLKENNGVVGINFCHDFLTTNKIATIKDVVKHITYVKNLIGIDYVALGSDFDGIDNKDLEMKDATYMLKIVDELKNQGYTSLEIDKITHLNVLRVLIANLK